MPIFHLGHIDDFKDQICIRALHPLDINKSIVLIKHKDMIYGYENICPHFSIQLDYQTGVFHTYQDRLIMCAHHSAMFDITTGECTDGPCKGHALKSLKIYQQDNHDVMLELDLE